MISVRHTVPPKWTNRKPIFVRGEHMNNKEKNLKNDFRVRLYDLEIVKSLHELMDTGNFDSMNELIGYAIGFGIEKIYLEYGKKKKLPTPALPDELPTNERLIRIERTLAENKIMLEDIFVMQNAAEALLSTIYNVERTQNAGEAVTSELMDSGFLSELPPFIADVKGKLIERIKRKQQKQNKGGE